MNHLITFRDGHNNVIYLHGGQFQYFFVNPKGETVICMTSGHTLIVTTPPETIENKMNKFYDDSIKMMVGLRKDDDDLLNKLKS